MNPNTKHPPGAKSQTINQAFGQLQEIISQVESGELDLETSIAKYEQGVKLAGWIKQRLQHLENQIITIDKSSPD